MSSGLMNTRSGAQPIEILLVEDNPADIRLTREGLRDAKIANVLHTVQSGDSALDFLFRRNSHKDAPRPELILLDLNLPGTDGREVLKAIKEDESLRVIPTIILTSSEAEADVLRSYELHANCYITKPIDYSSFIQAVRSIEQFWFSVVKLP